MWSKHAAAAAGTVLQRLVQPAPEQHRGNNSCERVVVIVMEINLFKIAFSVLLLLYVLELLKIAH